MERKIKILGTFLFVVMLAAAIYIFGRKPQPPPEDVEITFWNLWDDSDVLSQAIAAYAEIKPWVKIDYKKKTYNEYEELLINSMAAGKGPDIFTIHNTWLPKHKDKIAPVAEDLMTAGEYRDIFADVAARDLVEQDEIYAIPFSIDTLALYYNKDFFNSANIPFAPETWNEFNDAVKKLTLFDEQGDIIRAGAAIGTVDNINRSTDILNLLMLQQGSEIVDKESEQVTFNKAIQTADKTVIIPGLDALKFYTSFSNPLRSVYTWNSELNYSLDAFAYGEAAMMFGYSYHGDLVKFKTPGLNFGVAPMPQINTATNKVNYANYWAQTVSANSENAQEAWEFLLFLSNQNNLKGYLEKTNRPTSRRDMVFNRSEDSIMSIFDAQILSAKSWYQVNNVAIENILADMLKLIIQRKSTEENAMKQAADQIELLMKQY